MANFAVGLIALFATGQLALAAAPRAIGPVPGRVNVGIFFKSIPAVYWPHIESYLKQSDSDPAGFIQGVKLAGARPKGPAGIPEVSAKRLDQVLWRLDARVLPQSETEKLAVIAAVLSDVAAPAGRVQSQELLERASKSVSDTMAKTISGLLGPGWNAGSAQSSMQAPESVDWRLGSYPGAISRGAPSPDGRNPVVRPFFQARERQSPIGNNVSRRFLGSPHDVSPDAAVIRQVLEHALHDDAVITSLAAINPSHARPAQISEWLVKRYEAESGRRIPYEIRRAVPAALFEVEKKKEYLPSDGRFRNVFSALVEASRDASGRRYLSELEGRVRRAYARYFPSLDAPINVNWRFGSDYVWGRDREGKHVIRIQSIAPPLLHRGDGLQSMDVVGKGGLRRIVAFANLIHEFAHAIFDDAVFSKRDAAVLRARSWIEGSMSEGFAVMMELLIIDKMIRDANALGLSLDEVKDLIEHKRGRLELLPRNEMYYGGFRVWQEIYDRGGEAEILRVLKRIAPDSLKSREDSDILFLLARNSGANARSLLGGGGARRAALEALLSFVYQGTPIDPGLRPFVRRLAHQLSPDIVASLLEEINRAHFSVVDDWETRPIASWHPLFRFASLDGSIARQTAEFVVRRFDSNRLSPEFREAVDKGLRAMGRRSANF